MPDKEFLENYPLLTKKKISLKGDSHFWPKPALNMVCPKCTGIQTFSLNNEYGGTATYAPTPAETIYNDVSLQDLNYICESCKKHYRFFHVLVDTKNNFILKYGQWPAWEITIDKAIENMLGQFAGNFKKGLVCESQGYGIGAFAYYRRITEDIIDQLLDSIQGLIPEEDKVKYIEALQQTKTTRVTQEKINLVKDLLPSFLRPDGLNPLGILHTELSAGLHGESDEDCLESARHIKDVLIFLVNRILALKKDSLQFTSSMRALLDKKTKTD